MSSCYLKSVFSSTGKQYVKHNQFLIMETVVGPKTRLTNETLKIIYQRRAVRKFKDKPVDRKLIEQVISAGTMAPSAINKQPWKFYVLTTKLNIRNFSKEISKATLKSFFKSGVKEG